MTRDTTIATRAKTSVNSVGGSEFGVNRNHDGGPFNTPAEKNILHLVSSGSSFYSAAFDLAEARKIRDAITEVILDAEQIIEDAKPKPLTVAELDLKAVGTKVYALGISPDDEGTVWMRVHGGSWVVIEDGGRTHRLGDFYDADILDGVVVLNAEEVN